MDWALVEIPVLGSIVYERQTEVVLHERDVALNRFLRDFDLLRELTAIRESSPLNRLMDRENSLDGSTGVPGSVGRFLLFGSGFSARHEGSIHHGSPPSGPTQKLTGIAPPLSDVAGIFASSVWIVEVAA